MRGTHAHTKTHKYELNFKFQVNFTDDNAFSYQVWIMLENSEDFEYTLCVDVTGHTFLQRKSEWIQRWDLKTGTYVSADFKADVKKRDWINYSC